MSSSLRALSARLARRFGIRHLSSCWKSAWSTDVQRKGYQHFNEQRLLAIDGSTLRLPTSKELIEVFGTVRYMNLKRAVAGPKMAHLFKITSAFEFSVLTLTVPGFKPQKSSKSIVLLTTCAILVHLNCSF